MTVLLFSQGLAPPAHPKSELGISLCKSGQHPALMAWVVPDPEPLLNFPLGALPIKPLLTREFRTACRITFVCSSDRGSCICADLVPVSCLSPSCLSLPVSFSSGGLGTGRLPRPLQPGAGDVPRGCSHLHVSLQPWWGRVPQGLCLGVSETEEWMVQGQSNS